MSVNRKVTAPPRSPGRTRTGRSRAARAGAPWQAAPWGQPVCLRRGALLDRPSRLDDEVAAACVALTRSLGQRPLEDGVELPRETGSARARAGRRIVEVRAERRHERLARK